MKLWVWRRTDTEEDVERPTAVEVLGTETITLDGVANARAEVDDISWQSGGELAAARGRSCASGADGLRCSGAEEP
jgi:hypothetical protein